MKRSENKVPVPVPYLVPDQLSAKLSSYLQGVVDITLSGPIVLDAAIWDGEWPIVQQFYVTLSIMTLEAGLWYSGERIVEGFNDWLLAMARGVGKMKRIKRCAVEMNMDTSPFKVGFDGEKRKWEVMVGQRTQWNLRGDLKKEWEGMVGKEGGGCEIWVNGYCRLF